MIGSETDGGRHRAANRDNGSSVIPSVVMIPGFTALRRRVAIGGLVLLVYMAACSRPAGAREVNDSPTPYVTQLVDTALTPKVGRRSVSALFRYRSLRVGSSRTQAPSAEAGPGRVPSWLDTDRMGHCCRRARGRSSRDFAPAAARWSGSTHPRPGPGRVFLAPRMRVSGLADQGLGGGGPHRPRAATPDHGHESYQPTQQRR